MYSTCIFCSGPLGANEALEDFPVGRRLAFDAWKGRLWAICPRCARWNLAPIEERWEAVEDAEKRFRAARLRVNSENIGLARLPDGTDLIRVGEALPGELAAWRYGSQLARRRKRYLTAGVIAGTASLGALGLLATGAVGVVGVLFGWAVVEDFLRRRGEARVVHRLSPAQSPTGRTHLIQETHLAWARVEADPHDRLVLRIPKRHGRLALVGRIRSLPRLTLEDDVARRVLARAMVHVNEGGGSKRVIEHAVADLAAAGDPEELLRTTARRGLDLGQAFATTPLLHVPGLVKIDRGRKRMRLFTYSGRRVPEGLRPPDLLALEMALHEESERRALEGELAELEEAWREAEEIAGIADALPDDLPEELPRART
ncbi:MAG TPA: hypothetical protein VMK65_08345 [Longimicrobiales bacterium]|nr:hypothetical protein [Longimicrobiales bacterium]